MKLVIGNKNYSSWSLRAWLMMKESGLEFEEYRIALDTDTSCEEIRRYSPSGTVPVLLVGDEVVWDTMAIGETLAERWPEKRLWPAAPADRAYARAISAEMHAGFRALRETMPMNCRAMGRKVAITDAAARDIDRIFAIWRECHLRCPDGDGWLFGEFGIADAMFAPIVLRFRTYGINLPESASRYPRRLLESEAMQDWLIDSESETEVIKREEAGQ